SDGETAGGEHPRGRRASGDARPTQREGCRADREATHGRANRRPARLPLRPRRPPDPQGKLRAPTEFGYVEQLAEVTPNTKPGVRGFIPPPATAPGNPGENELL